MYNSSLFNRRNKMQRRILFVVSSSGSPSTSDQSFHDLMEQQVGYGNNVVDYITASGIIESDADGYDIIVVSASVNSGDVSNTFRTTPKSVVAFEMFIADDMDMITTPVYDSATTQTINITNSTHPLAAGYSGSTTVYNNTPGRMYGNGFSSDVIVIGNTGSAGDNMFFAYEKGSTMQNALVAPERRVGLGYQNTVDLTAAGQALLIAAVEWALYIN